MSIADGSYTLITIYCRGNEPISLKLDDIDVTIRSTSHEENWLTFVCDQSWISIQDHFSAALMKWAF